MYYTDYKETSYKFELDITILYTDLWRFAANMLHDLVTFSQCLF